MVGSYTSQLYQLLYLSDQDHMSLLRDSGRASGSFPAPVSTSICARCPLLESS